MEQSEQVPTKDQLPIHCAHGKPAYLRCGKCEEDFKSGKSNGFTPPEQRPSKELTDRLRLRANSGAFVDVICQEAADEIERLQTQIATLKGYIERTALAGYRCAECAARLTAEPPAAPVAPDVPSINGSVIDGLEHLLRRESDANVEILPDGSVRAAQPPGADHAG